MAYVAISNGLKQEVGSLIHRMHQSEIAATFTGNNIQAWPELVFQPDDPLFDVFWKEAPQLKGQIPKKWLDSMRQFDANIHLDNEVAASHRYSLTEPFWGPNCSGYAPDINVTNDPRFAATKERLLSIRSVDARWEKVKEQVIGFLNSCKSLNEAVKLYPDIVHYIPPSTLNKLNEQKVKAAKEVSAAVTKLAELDTAALSAAPVLARITGHK